MRLQNSEQLLVHTEPAVVVIVDAVALASAQQRPSSQFVRLHVLQRWIHYQQRHARNELSASSHPLFFFCYIFFFEIFIFVNLYITECVEQFVQR